MPLSDTICYNLSQSDTICHNLSQSDTICHNLLQSDTIRHHLQQSVTIPTYVPSRQTYLMSTFDILSAAPANCNCQTTTLPQPGTGITGPQMTVVGTGPQDQRLVTWTGPSDTKLSTLDVYIWHPLARAELLKTVFLSTFSTSNVYSTGRVKWSGFFSHRADVS